VLAQTDLPTYRRLTAVDLNDPGAVLDAVETIQRWRRDIAARHRSFTFGPRHGNRTGISLAELARCSGPA
jgi:hypothetical protein